MKIFAVVILYNPEINNVIRICESLFQQGIKHFFICNNSDYDVDFSVPNIQLEIVNFGKNLGIAEAQNIGMERAFNAGADFIIQMDQDSEPDSNMVKHLINGYENSVREGIKVGLIGPLDVDKVTGKKNAKRLRTGTLNETTGLYDVSYTLSSGSLIPSDAYHSAGGMMSSLFIDYVDHEYCWRLQSLGYRTLINPAAILYHRLGDGRKVIPLFGTIGVTSPFRLYYSFRNMVLLMTLTHVPLKWKITTVVTIPIKIVSYFIFLKNRRARMYFIFKGLCHGLMRRRGKLT